MSLSVVVPTLNARDTLARCLDSLAEYAPDAEVLVVNGPSADGTTGMVRERSGIAVLVELADRDINVARNAGIDRASGESIAFLDHRLTIGESWLSSITNGLGEVDVVTGPTRPELDTAIEHPETTDIAGRTVSMLNPGNVAFRDTVLDELDGFDEYLPVGGMRDIAHRLAGYDFDVRWDGGIETTAQLDADGGDRDWGWKYRSLAYRLVKNYNLRPTVVRRLLSHAGSDAYAELRRVFSGEAQPSRWLSNGRAVIGGLGRGIGAGLLARRRDKFPRRNPHGRSSRADRAVTVYDWR